MRISGSPPHARGRRGFVGQRDENSEDHPRMRGEDPPVPGLRYPPTPSPPHARGRPVLLRLCESNCRITPACAGKTKKSPKKDSKSPDHPRMRGEDRRCSFADFLTLGSPPHARGRPWKHEGRFERARITPACAGKTNGHSLSTFRARDHPRMRGEDPCAPADERAFGGSPPHARGRRKPHNVGPGRTPDHPRMRGEDSLHEKERT